MENELEGQLGYKGERGFSAYELAVKHGYTGTEEQWVQDFTNAENFYDKMEMDSILNGYVENSTLSNYVPKSDIVNNLTSTDTDKPLSAKQGKELKDDLDTKAEASNTYTKSEVDTLFTSYVTKGTFAIIETTAKEWSEQESLNINYPTGFTYSNCIVLAVNSYTGLYGLGGSQMPSITARSSDYNQYLAGSYATVRTDQANLVLTVSSTGFATKFIIVLMKIS